ncbi:hypothetical protein ACN4GL_11530, partial [Burkholderia pseudomallei]
VGARTGDARIAGFAWRRPRADARRAAAMAQCGRTARHPPPSRLAKTDGPPCSRPLGRIGAAAYCHENVTIATIARRPNETLPNRCMNGKKPKH